MVITTAKFITKYILYEGLKERTLRNIRKHFKPCGKKYTVFKHIVVLLAALLSSHLLACHDFRLPNSQLQ
jgi:hypothetical protein